MSKRRLIFQILLPPIILLLALEYFRQSGALPGFHSIDDYYQRAEVYRKHAFIWIITFLPASIGIALLLSQNQYLLTAWNRAYDCVMGCSLSTFLIVSCGVSLIASSVTAVWMIGATPRVLDEFNYYFQAQNFSNLMLSAPAPPMPELFRFPFIIFHDGRWFGSVYPGFSLFLAAGLKLGIPWIINPVFSAVTVCVIYLLGREALTEQTGRVAAILTVFSPFHRMMGAIFMSHASATAWGALSVYLLWRHTRDRERRPIVVSVAAGCAIGVLYWIRPQSAGVVLLPMVPIMASLIWNRKVSVIRLIFLITPVVIAIVLLAGYNSALTGDGDVNPRYFIDPGRRLGFGDDIGEPLPGGGRSGHTILKGIRNVGILLNLWNSDLFGTGAIGLIGIPLLLTLAGVSTRCAKYHANWIMAGSLAINLCLYFFYYTPSPNFGPRYLAETIPASMILAAWGLLRLDRNAHAISATFASLTLVFCLLISSATMLPIHTVHYGILPPTLERDRIPDMPGSAIYLIDRKDYCLNVFTWNQPDLRGDVFIVDPGDSRALELQRFFPEKALFRIELQGTDRPVVLHEIRAGFEGDTD